MYLYPCQPNEMAPTSDEFLEIENDPNWWAEAKKNGWRCLYFRDTNELWTRHKTLIPTDDFQELLKQLSKLPPGTIIDGELIDRRTTFMKRTYYFFDVIMFDGKDFTSTPYKERHALVKWIQKKYFPKFAQIITPEPRKHGKLLYFKQVLKDKENEGIVMKHVNGKYMASTKKGTYNPYWIKVKER